MEWLRRPAARAVPDAPVSSSLGGARCSNCYLQPAMAAAATARATPADQHIGLGVCPGQPSDSDSPRPGGGRFKIVDALAEQKTRYPKKKQETGGDGGDRRPDAPPHPRRSAAPTHPRDSDAPPPRRPSDASPPRRTSDTPPLRRPDAPPTLRRLDAHPTLCRPTLRRSAASSTPVLVLQAVILPQGQKWTFETKAAGGSYTRVRLDRALGSAEWCAQFPLAVVEHLTVATSDHSPLLLKLDPPTRRPVQERQLRYECMWDTHPELVPTVQHAWVANGPNLTVAEVRANLESLSNNLGEWSKSTFGNVKAEIRRLKKDLQRLRSNPLRVGLSHVGIKINDRLIELYLREEVMWRQRSRVEWLSAGDRNTHFFHLQASMRRPKNPIKALQKQDGQLTEDLTEMQQLAQEFYKNLYTSEGVEGVDDVL
ncbi:uncharacterized protein [Triticum aestivum]|uniref:uncharacterized protein n=1 Tax=Triticum aestivum TaxID=4565 RepID=UPI001D025BE6|nr:uncharacterized protein LOC123057264 [Triticum aestivum]